MRCKECNKEFYNSYSKKGYCSQKCEENSGKSEIDALKSIFGMD